jgi:hypothetical protein
MNSDVASNFLGPVSRHSLGLIVTSIVVGFVCRVIQFRIIPASVAIGDRPSAIACDSINAPAVDGQGNVYVEQSTPSNSARRKTLNVPGPSQRVPSARCEPVSSPRTSIDRAIVGYLAARMGPAGAPPAPRAPSRSSAYWHPRSATAPGRTPEEVRKGTRPVGG